MYGGADEEHTKRAAVSRLDGSHLSSAWASNHVAGQIGRGNIPLTWLSEFAYYTGPGGLEKFGRYFEKSCMVAPIGGVADVFVAV